ncbi:MAG TPA: DUF2505 domain-containing protein [Frankiaceae bacterium]|jgi:hypothetical protein|nr:DUF2505 domain-containing protein [Frankiaceae bacterium]
MDLQTEYRFEATADEVFAMFSDPEYQKQKLVDAGHTHVEVVECGPGADGKSFRIVTRRTVAVDVPGVLKRVLTPTNTVTQTDEWAEDKKGTRSGTWKVDIKGVPIHLSGTMQIKAAKSGCVETISGKAKASLPLVGGKLEKLAGGNFNESTAQEQDFSNRWLAGEVS